MKDITHIERSPLPWRPERATECGLDATRHPTWTRAEAQAKHKELGAQRFSLFVCRRDCRAHRCAPRRVRCARGWLW